MGQIQNAAQLFHQAAEQKIDDNALRNGLAWTLAVSQHKEIRNANLALTLGQRAVSADPNASYLDTYAAALAEGGNFEEAIEVQENAISELSSIDSGEGDESPTMKHLLRVHQSNPLAVLFVVADYKREFTQRLELYNQSKPFRE